MTELYVFKLGGSSVSSIGSLEHFAKRLELFDDKQIFIVVSALSGVTDHLVKLADLTAQGQIAESTVLLEGLRTRHLNMLLQLLPANLAPVVAEDLVKTLDALASYCRACAGPGFLPRDRDRILTCGEALSSILICAYLASKGLDIQKVDATDILVTDDFHGEAEPLREPTQARLDSLVRPLLQAGKAVITQGFCGATHQGEPTTLGRGGSDFSATYLGALLGATEIEIRTDTPGVLSADPRLIPNTRVIRAISHRRASTLAHFGAKVLHPRCIEPVIESAIPVRVLSSFEPEDPGTLIGCEDQVDGFSVTGCRGTLGRILRPLDLEPAAFRASLEALATSPGYLASSADEHEAICAWSALPQSPALPAQLHDRIALWPTGWLYLLLPQVGESQLAAFSNLFREEGFAITAAFVDPIGQGLVFAIGEEQIAAACKHAHRHLLRQAMPSVVSV